MFRRFSAEGPLALALLATLATACDDGETARSRGDRLWADAHYTEALAEYRLAMAQSGQAEETLLRAAHAYAETDQFERARQLYDRLLAGAPEYTDQVIYDYLRLAQRARARGDRYAMAGATEAALALAPRVPLPELAVPLARYYRGLGDAERALEYYLRAVTQARPDSVAPLLYEIGVLNEELDRCQAAIGYFDAYRQQAGRGARVGEARWHTGQCAFELARQARQTGHLAEAMAQLDIVLELRVPANVQDEAWFERGEILFALGRFDDALIAYRTVLELNPARTGRLVERARQRIDQIRFGA